MAWIFTESWDCYMTATDALGYWDVVNNNNGTIVAGRFSSSRAMTQSNSNFFTKSSNVNDAVHHFVVAFNHAAALGGNAIGLYFQLLDGATPQCCVAFRSDGAIILTAGSPSGAAITTYADAFLMPNVWDAFEIEVVISNTNGYMKVRKNGNTTEDFTSVLTLDTQGSANSYANRLTVGAYSDSSCVWDDFIWRSAAVSVAWMGDLKCNTRYPVSDVAVQFSRTTPVPQTFYSGVTAVSPQPNQGKYIVCTPTISGSVSAVTFTQHTGTPATGNMKCGIYATNPGTTPLPAALLATATAPINCSTIGAGGAITFSFSPPLVVTAGTTYAVGYNFDSSNGFLLGLTLAGSCSFDSSSYATFPLNNPSGLNSTSLASKVMITLTPAANYMVVNEVQQDAATSYVYDSVAGHGDFYGIAPIASTPVSTFAVVTRALMTKSDAGTRTAAVQIKSGGTTVASSASALSATAWQWVWRLDLTDPATGVAWTTAAVNTAQVGPVVVA